MPGSQARRTRLGRGGPTVSVVGLGLWQQGSRMWGNLSPSPERVAEGLRIALEAGINLFDTAEVYGWGSSERVLGRALKELGRELAEEAVVVSKVAGFRSDPGDIVRAARGIAGRIGRPVDVLLHHWPPPLWRSSCTVAKGLEAAVKEGYANFYGYSNYDERLLREALECSKRLEPVAIQAQYSLAYRVSERGLMGIARESGLGFIAWSPLAKGALAGVTRPVTGAQRGDPVFRAAAQDTGLQLALDEASRRLGAGRAEIALAWVVHKGAIPIMGWRRPERVKTAIRAALLELTGEVIDMLERASKHYLERWGDKYKFEGESLVRLTPGILQKAILAVRGGL